MYLDPRLSTDCRQEHTQSKVISYQDERGQTKHLRWWTRLPASVEFQDRKKKQQEMALRLSQLPKLKPLDTERRKVWSPRNSQAKIALEPFNPWSVERQEIRNYSMKLRTSSQIPRIT